jgi:hypothetical protein
MMIMKFNLNRNQVMLLVGLIVAEGPDVAAVANFLASSGIPHLTGVVHFLGWLSTALASAALAWPSIRDRLSKLGFATAPSSVTPSASGTPAPVIPLMDGSSVVQVTPPTPTSVSGVQPSLVSVAADPKQVAPTSTERIPRS